MERLNCCHKLPPQSIEKTFGAQRDNSQAPCQANGGVTEPNAAIQGQDAAPESGSPARPPESHVRLSASTHPLTCPARNKHRTLHRRTRLRHRCRSRTRRIRGRGE